MSNKKKIYKIIRVIAWIVLMVLQGGDVPVGDAPKGPEYMPVGPVERLICQPEVMPQLW